MTLRLALHTGQLERAVPGGIGRYVAGLLSHLPGAGVTVESFTASRWHHQAWHRFRGPPLRLPAAIDVVHAPSLAVPPAGRRPLVVTVHDLAFSYLTARGAAFHRRGFEIARAEAAAVVVPSAFTGAEVEAAGFGRELIHVVPHGIDPPPDVSPGDVSERLDRLGVATPYLLAVGTIEARKGLDVLASARAALGDVPLILAGPPGWGDVPGLDRPGIRRLGTVAEPDLDALYRGAVCLVVPSRTEGFGLPALEAMARGCPVVVSDGGALPEVAGDAGVVVPGGDPDALGDALASLVADENRRRQLCEAGRKRAAEFTWTACVEGHVSAYQAALGTARGRS